MKNLILTVQSKEREARIIIMIVMAVLASIALILGFYHEMVANMATNSLLFNFVLYGFVNIGPELAGMMIGVFILDTLNSWRQDNHLRQQLVLQMGSQHQDAADMAVRTLRSYGWVDDGTLIGANLSEADLSRTDLSKVTLAEATLTGANLSKSKLTYANLQQANLSEANLWRANLRNSILVSANLRSATLSQAYLTNANLENADLRMADLSPSVPGRSGKTGNRLLGLLSEESELSGADLMGANLKGADLRGADLTRANLMGVTGYTKEQLLETVSLQGAIMPDGREYEEWAQDYEQNETDI